MSFNTHEHVARERKAHDLAAAYQAHADGLGADRKTAQEAAERMPETFWADLAEAHGIRKPSAATISRAVKIIGVNSETPNELLARVQKNMTGNRTDLFAGLT